MEPDQNSPEDRPSLHRALSLPLLTLYGLGVTLGAGIYVLVGATAALAGTFAPIAFLCAAIVVGVTALSYAELATRFPVSAGEAAYIDAGFGLRYLTLSVGLLVALSGIVSSAAVAIGAASYLTDLAGLPVPLLIVITVLVMGLLAIWGIAQSVTIAAIVTLIEVAGLVLVLAWSQLGPTEPVLPVTAVLPPFSTEAWAGIGAATILAFFAFIGFEDMANVAEEVKDPVRNFPRAVIITLLVTTILYVLTTVAVVTSVPLEELQGSSAPLLLVFQSAPSVLRDAFAGIAVIATLNGILIQIIMASRVIYGLADRGFLPPFLARVNARTRTPIIATLAIVLVVLILAQAFPIEFLAERTSQIVLLIFALVNVALIRIKRRARANEADHFNVPALVPVCGAVISLTFFVLGFL
jgi:basic amino acid/polyamine antiporter, APA family